MTDSFNSPALTSNRLLSSLPLESLVRMVASSDDAIEGLRAMATEVGGRDGGKIAAVSERLRRGGSITEESGFGSQAIPILQAAAKASASESVSESGSFHGSRLPRWVMLEDQRTQVRTSLRRIVWAGLLYLLIASAVGFGIQNMFVPFLDYFGISGYEFDFLDRVVNVNEVLFFVYIGLIIVAVLLMLSWACRSTVGARIGGTSQWSNGILRVNELFWNVVPFVGSTYRSIDLAQMSEAICQSLSVGWTLPVALRAAAEQSKSTILRIWLFGSADRLDRGESFESVLNTCPLGAYWLRGLSQVLSKPMSDCDLSEQWRYVSDKLHILMLNRGQRALVTLVPATVLFSVSVLLIGWGHLLGIIFSLISGLI